jgi:hypothetical protein
MAITVRSHSTSVRGNPTYQAYLTLRTGFIVAPILFGLDKFTNLLTDWTTYLAPAIDRLVPGSASGPARLRPAAGRPGPGPAGHRVPAHPRRRRRHRLTTPRSNNLRERIRRVRCRPPLA